MILNKKLCLSSLISLCLLKKRKYSKCFLQRKHFISAHIKIVSFQSGFIHVTSRNFSILKSSRRKQRYIKQLSVKYVVLLINQQPGSFLPRFQHLNLPISQLISSNPFNIHLCWMSQKLNFNLPSVQTRSSTKTGDVPASIYGFYSHPTDTYKNVQV